ncbi:peptide deformylase [Kocuria palustris]|uniref:peptide deformylase n=1 Tax=Kocuria palustris TaxID=71999 RepID=UPI00119E1948|nr:peptide deformylase [Kocuria palustris]
MTVRPIRTIGDPILRSAADPVRRFDAELLTLVDDMFETMRDVDGVGLAAPQIGVGLQVFVYDVEGDSGVFVNPELELGDEEQEGGEGCLSVPGLGFDTPRRSRARVRGLDEHGQARELEAEGLLARCLQHEHDHLQGVLYVNRLEGQARREAWRRIRAGDYARTVAEVRDKRAGSLGSSFGG